MKTAKTDEFAVFPRFLAERWDGINLRERRKLQNSTFFWLSPVAGRIRNARFVESLPA